MIASAICCDELYYKLFKQSPVTFLCACPVAVQNHIALPLFLEMFRSLDLSVLTLCATCFMLPCRRSIHSIVCRPLPSKTANMNATRQSFPLNGRTRHCCWNRPGKNGTNLVVTILGSILVFQGFSILFLLFSPRAPSKLIDSSGP